MKIELSRDEYRNLLDLLYMGEWMLDAHDVTHDSKKKYAIAAQKFYSYAKEMGFENLVLYEEELKEYFPTREFEEISEARNYIDEYDNETLWDELVDRLIERDMQAMIRSGSIKKTLTVEERFKIQEPIESKYYDEFQKNGLENVVIRGDEDLKPIN